MTLRSILNNIEKFEWTDALFLPEDETWSLDTQGAVIDPDDVEDDNYEVPKFAQDNNLMYALDIQTIKGIIKNAYEQKADCTDKDLIEAFLYYYDNDAFMIIK
ncbi:hypothetical protein [Paenibacillus alvei]|uniref:DUF7716 domain-containing protein n=1 Tax=Paenibacillus alvei TaxID=44250 RepID=A0ABT4E548_PAEAL|nr:hypothetical protein [Paenibacillus alvei]EPY12847.1 hypothetical protein PAAL66ix_10696 [Paenibacillus alvei A6-6i-x]MCY9528230.1 hypothetical protein [Paenibacillus alvei]